MAAIAAATNSWLRSTRPVISTSMDGTDTVRRFWRGEDDEYGHLVHTRGRTWAFHYDINGQDDDEPGFKFDSHVFKPGEYVSIREHDGRLRTFKVAAIEPLRTAKIS